jgi:hypothetical protein
VDEWDFDLEVELPEFGPAPFAEEVGAIPLASAVAEAAMIAFIAFAAYKVVKGWRGR